MNVQQPADVYEEQAQRALSRFRPPPETEALVLAILSVGQRLRELTVTVNEAAQRQQGPEVNNGRKG